MSNGVIIPMDTIEREDRYHLGDMMHAAMRLGALSIYQHTDLYDRPKSSFRVKITMRIQESKVEATGEADTLIGAMENAIAAARRFAR